jgi:hypothetical protein
MAWISEAADGRKFQRATCLPVACFVRGELSPVVGHRGTIRQGLGAIGLVDGHDIGAGEMNVFIHSDDRKGTFGKAMSLIQGKYDLKELIVGYRNFEHDDYTPVFPPGLTVFRVA